MNRMAWGVLLVLTAWGAIVWLRRRRERLRDDPVRGEVVRGDENGSAPADDIDFAALEEAEREVREMDGDIGGGPPEESPGDDWGPGARRPPPPPPPPPPPA